MRSIHIFIFKENLLITDQNPMIIHPASCLNPNCNCDNLKDQEKLKIFYDRAALHYDCVFDKTEYSVFNASEPPFRTPHIV